MVLNLYKIERLKQDLSTVDKGLKLAFARNVGDSIQVNNVSLPLAGQDSTKNFSRNFGGFQRLVTVDFVLTNDGTDKSTEGANVISLKEQRDYLMKTGGVIQGIATGEQQFDVKYKLTIYEDGTTTEIIGTIEDINIQGNNNESNIFSGSLNMFEAGI